jgi:hypothetical protein
MLYVPTMSEVDSFEAFKASNFKIESAWMITLYVHYLLLLLSPSEDDSFQACQSRCWHTSTSTTAQSQGTITTTGAFTSLPFLEDLENNIEKREMNESE